MSEYFVVAQTVREGKPCMVRLLGPFTDNHVAAHSCLGACWQMALEYDENAFFYTFSVVCCATPEPAGRFNARFGMPYGSSLQI